MRQRLPENVVRMARRLKTLGIRNGVGGGRHRTNGLLRRQGNTHEHRGPPAGARFNLDEPANQRGSLPHTDEADTRASLVSNEESKPPPSSSMTS